MENVTGIDNFRIPGAVPVDVETEQGAATPPVAVQGTSGKLVDAVKITAVVLSAAQAQIQLLAIDLAAPTQQHAGLGAGAIGRQLVPLGHAEVVVMRGY